MAEIVICDIDGTIAHHTEDQRGHFEYDKVHLDTPIKPIIRLVSLLSGSYEVERRRLTEAPWADRLLIEAGGLAMSCADWRTQ